METQHAGGLLKSVFGINTCERKERETGMSRGWSLAVMLSQWNTSVISPGRSKDGMTLQSSLELGWAGWAQYYSLIDHWMWAATKEAWPGHGSSLQLKKPLRGLIVEGFLPAAWVINPLILKGDPGSKYQQLPHNPCSGTHHTCYTNLWALFVQ